MDKDQKNGTNEPVKTGGEEDFGRLESLYVREDGGRQTVPPVIVEQADKFGSSAVTKMSKSSASSAKQFLDAQKKAVAEGNQEIAIPPGIFAKVDDFDCISKPSIEKGQKRLKLKHPLRNLSIFDVLSFLKPLRRCCSGSEGSSDAMDATLKTKSGLKNDKNNDFIKLQRIGRFLRKQGRKDDELRVLLRKYYENDHDVDEDEFRGRASSQLGKEGSDSDEEDIQLQALFGQLLDDEQKGFGKKKEKKQDRPFLNYGTGIQNYFVLQERMISLFITLTLLTIPQMLIYSYFQGYNYTSSEPIYAELSFGSMGYSGSTCGMNFIDWTRPSTSVNLQCQGTARIRTVIDSGLVDVNQGGESATLNEFNRCFYDRPIDASQVPVMTDFDLASVTFATLTQCNGLQQCLVSLDHSMFNVPSSIQNYDQFVFIQAGCEQDEEMLWLKNVLGLCASIIGLFICIFFLNTMDVFRATNLLNEKIFDGELITLGDYSVQGKINKNVWDNFIKKCTDKDLPILQFEKFLAKEVSLWLQREDENQKAKEANYLVADTQFAFDNDGMQKLLWKRGSALKARKFEKAREIQKKMTEYKDKNFNEITVPKVVFFTFHTEYAYKLALQHQQLPIDFGDKGEPQETIKLSQATEPTDLIWENRHITQQERRVRWVFVIFIMMILAIGSFTFIFWLIKRKLLVQYIKNPPGIECDSVRLGYGDDLKQFAYKEELEWQKIDPYEFDFNKITSRQGALSCFCKNEEAKGEQRTELYSVVDSAGNGLLYPICEKWIKDTSNLSGLGILTNGTSFLIVLTSFILRNIFIYLISLSRENKNTKIASATMYSVLMVSFFNYGLLYIIAPWNFVEQGADDGDFFAGLYTDFTSQWFLDIGSLVAETTALNMIFPIIEAALFWIIRHVKRCKDQRSLCPFNQKNSHAKTIQQFEALYAGPAFFVHYRLAFIVSNIFVSFLFGAGCPLLFPITCAGLMFTYVTERLRMAYSYQKPPMYDSRLTQNTFKALSLAPIFYCLYSAWLFSNQQVFKNKIPVIEDFKLYPLQGHKFEHLITQATPATPFVVLIIILIVFYLVRNIKRCCTPKEDKTHLKELVVLESLDPFFPTLKNKDREFWFREETVCRERLNLRRMNNIENFMALTFSEPNMRQRRLRSVHNYDILTNPTYSDRFHYVPAAYEERSDYIISEYKDPWMQNYSSDIVRLACDLPYLPIPMAKKLQFDEEFIFREQCEKNRKDGETSFFMHTEMGESQTNIMHQEGPEKNDKTQANRMK